MALTAYLYNCSDDPRVLSKTLEGGTIVSQIQPTESCDLLNPVFILNYNSSYTTCNYVKVGTPFDRSYFITDMKVDIGSKITISCAVDVLDTYKADIEKLEVNIKRSENPKTTDGQYEYIPDSTFNVRSGFQYYHETFKNNTDSFQSGSFVLSWMGGEYDSAYIQLYEEPADWNSNWGSYYIYDEREQEHRQLSSVYPSASVVPSFQTMNAVWGGVFTHIG